MWTNGKSLWNLILLGFHKCPAQIGLELSGKQDNGITSCALNQKNYISNIFFKQNDYIYINLLFFFITSVFEVKSHIYGIPN